MIMKMPTTRETPAKTSRNVCRKPMISSRLSWLVLTYSSPVRATTPFGSSSCAASRSCTWLTPGAALSEIVE